MPHWENYITGGAVWFLQTQYLTPHDETRWRTSRVLKALLNVFITERSDNLRNDLKKDILEAVSSLRNYFVNVQPNLEAKTAAVAYSGFFFRGFNKFS
jgi:hypothetical protein